MEHALFFVVAALALAVPVARLVLVRWEMRNNRRWRLERERRGRQDHERFERELDPAAMRSGAR